MNDVLKGRKQKDTGPGTELWEAPDLKGRRKEEEAVRQTGCEQLSKYTAQEKVVPCNLFKGLLQEIAGRFYQTPPTNQELELSIHSV